MRLRSRRARGEPMPLKFRPLAQYNAERARGIVHTPEWAAHMASMRAEFDDWMRRTHLSSDRPHAPRVPPGDQAGTS